MLTALLCVTVLATPAQPAGPTARGDVWRLAHEIMLLVQLNQLRLTEQQVAAILDAYGKTEPQEMATDQTIEELKRIKARLLSGEEVSWRELRDAFATLRSPLRGRRRIEEVGKLADQVAEILEDWQKALLIASRAGRFGGPQRLRAVGNAAADALVRLTTIPDAQWPDERDRLARRISAAAGGDEQVFAAARDFLDRVRKMDEAAIRGQASELAAELQALLPPGVPAVALLSPVENVQVRKRLIPLLADPLLPAVLRELAQARGWTVPAE